MTQHSTLGTRYSRRYLPLVIALILLLIAASRAFRLDATVTEVTADEVWSVWQTFGTPGQIVRWTPYDWPPGYYLALGGWRELVGLHPIALRWLSLLSFVFGAAALYRVARRLGGSGVIAMLAYAAFGYLIFMSTELRGYILLLALYPLAIWLALRYFDHPRWQRAPLLALTMAVMVYISFTSLVALAALALFLLIVYRRAIWRGWLPGSLTLLLILPEVVAKTSIAVSRTGATATIVLKPFFDALAENYSLWAGNAFPLWLILFVIAVFLLTRIRRRSLALALIVWALLPVLLYFTNRFAGFFNVRYAWWVMPGIALLLAVGLERLPAIPRGAAAAAFAVLALLPIPLNHYQIPQPPLGTNFDWLRLHAQPGDVLLIDPKCACGEPEVYEYYTRVYFPQGLPYVTDPANYRRIWYVTGVYGTDPDIHDRVTQGRIAERFVGPPGALFRLYEAPPNPTGIAYPNHMVFHGLDALDQTGAPVYHEDQPLHVRLWWSADAPPPLDYSVGLFILNDKGDVIAQSDSAPQVIDAPQATSQWQPGQLYTEERTLQLPYPLDKGQYHLKMAVYWFGDQKRLAAPGVDTNNLLPLYDFAVTSWGH